jgi:hypothetical protein
MTEEISKVFAAVKAKYPSKATFLLIGERLVAQQAALNADPEELKIWLLNWSTVDEDTLAKAEMAIMLLGLSCLQDVQFGTLGTTKTLVFELNVLLRHINDSVQTMVGVTMFAQDFGLLLSKRTIGETPSSKKEVN